MEGTVLRGSCVSGYVRVVLPQFLGPNKRMALLPVGRESKRASAFLRAFAKVE